MGFFKELFLSLLLTIFLVVVTDQFYNKNQSSKIYHTKNYDLTFENINPKYDKETFLFPYHIFLFRGNLSSEAFRIYSHALVFGFSWILIWILLQSTNFLIAFLYMIALAISPVYLIQWNWIGFPEHLVFFLQGILILVLYFRDAFSQFTLHGILMVLFLLGLWTHFYQFILSSFFILLVDTKFRKDDPIFVYANFLFSIFLARILANLLFSYFGVHQESDRVAFAFSRSISDWYQVHKVPLPFTFWNVFHGLVFWIGYLVFFRKEKFLLGLILVCAGVTFFTYDTTRVFSNLFYPSFFYYLILKLESEVPDSTPTYAVLLGFGLLLTILTKPFYIWGSRTIHLNFQIQRDFLLDWNQPSNFLELGNPNLKKGSS